MMAWNRRVIVMGFSPEPSSWVKTALHLVQVAGVPGGR